jgi:hypothetical protein
MTDTRPFRRTAAGLALALVHGTGAVVVATGITGVLEGVLGRARPYASADTNPRDS